MKRTRFVPGAYRENTKDAVGAKVKLRRPKRFVAAEQIEDAGRKETKDTRIRTVMATKVPKGGK